jgi:hypothetical protein
MGVRCFRAALKTEEFQQSSMGKVNAVFRELTNTAVKLLSHYTSGRTGGSSGPRAGEEMNGKTGTSSSPDADDMPGSTDTDFGTGGG